MKVAIVILNWNGHDMMEKYLPSVIEHSRGEGVSVIVADNASTDNSVDILRRKFPSCGIIQLEENWGFAEGYNRALRQIESDYYLLLNSDVEVTPRWLEPLVRFMDDHADVAACQPKMLSIYNKVKFEYAGAAGGFLDKYGYPFCRGRVFDTVEQDDGQYDDTSDILWASGACLLIRSTDYWKAGGLDGRFFAHQEEIDLCWRLRLRGRRVCCVTESKVYHVGGGTLPKNSPMKTFLNFRNNLTMLYKNLPDSELRHVMCVRTLLDYIAAIKMLASGQFACARAAIRGRRAFNKWRKDFDADRQQIQSQRMGNNVTGIIQKPILLAYYLRGKHSFREIVQQQPSRPS